MAPRCDPWDEKIAVASGSRIKRRGSTSNDGEGAAVGGKDIQFGKMRVDKGISIAFVLEIMCMF